MRTGLMGQIYGPNESDMAKLQDEIDRLREFLDIKEKAVQSLLRTVEARDAEIEQLKLHWSWEQDAHERVKRDCGKYTEIIAELADAFANTFNALLLVSDVDYNGDDPEDSTEWKLIKRAREATKHE